MLRVWGKEEGERRMGAGWGVGGRGHVGGGREAGKGEGESVGPRTLRAGSSIMVVGHTRLVNGVGRRVEHQKPPLYN